MVPTCATALVPGGATVLVPVKATVRSRHRERLGSCKGNAGVPGAAKATVFLFYFGAVATSTAAIADKHGGRDGTG
ncbi:hypothetical protein CE91St1_55530 [Parabacteroides goldsteinii]|uniref:hypothetical protein n=1 Tax=Parabacteroides sp. AM58-2XD TaxID=2292362 RepID=UPI000FE220AD|nr:hypothetical protein [Parabacteroides sp. AM58-2XD]GKG76410.1 hypothetical protein CE91St1_55530 [Parabacteroides goldsteinii]GKG80182.1 hypothetical protein CE91St2_33740 [Parabacteroides goldsteinii]